MITAYRICGTKWVGSAFTGEGAKMAGGRWNSAGRPVVYCSSSLSLATLEILVHLEDRGVLTRHFSFFEIRIPKNVVTISDPNRLPEDWTDEAGEAATRALGDSWLRSMNSAVLGVPSAVTPGEMNYLLDPRHLDYRRIEIGVPKRFSPDPRLTV